MKYMGHRSSPDLSVYYAGPVRLWILRILKTPKGLSKFITQHGFRDDDVAVFIGLEKFTEVGPTDFDPAGARKAVKECAHRAEALAGQTKFPAKIQSNFMEMGRIAGLNKIDLKVLQFIAFRQIAPILNDALSTLGELPVTSCSTLVAGALNLPLKPVTRALSFTGPLVRSGLIKYEESPIRRSGLPEFFNSYAAQFLIHEDFKPDLLLTKIVRQSPAPTLSYRDYPHLKDSLDVLRPYLRNVLKLRKKGVNILIHGYPGTGKTELTRILAREMRCPLNEVATGDDDGDPTTAKERLESLRLANTLLTKRSILLFDEAEDVFRDGLIIPNTANQHKGWMNRMLEENRLPTLWVTNSIASMDPASIRRFDQVFELPIPDKRQREKTFRRICGKTVSKQIVAKVAQSQHVAPAIVARASRVIDSISETLSETARDKAFECLVNNTLKAQGRKEGLKEQTSTRLPRFYHTRFLNSDADLEALSQALKDVPSARICLYGPPGTGKTSFAHWIAEATGKPLHVKRASDILSPYVGMTEQKLAEAFALARDESAIMLLDEVDSFLQDRGKAVRSWEVTGVNEFLTQMEAYDGIFIASTNRMDELDQASLRRFDLKIYFDFLTSDQARHLFSEHCRQLGLPRPSGETLRRMDSMPSLTPGDFTNVARQHKFRSFKKPDDLLDALSSECHLKKIPTRRALGFDG